MVNNEGKYNMAQEADGVGKMLMNTFMNVLNKWLQKKIKDENKPLKNLQ